MKKMMWTAALSCLMAGHAFASNLKKEDQVKMLERAEWADTILSDHANKIEYPSTMDRDLAERTKEGREKAYSDAIKFFDDNNIPKGGISIDQPHGSDEILNRVMGSFEIDLGVIAPIMSNKRFWQQSTYYKNFTVDAAEVEPGTPPAIQGPLVKLHQFPEEVAVEIVTEPFEGRFPAEKTAQAIREIISMYKLEQDEEQKQKFLGFMFRKKQELISRIDSMDDNLAEQEKMLQEAITLAKTEELNADGKPFDEKFRQTSIGDAASVLLKLQERRKDLDAAVRDIINLEMPKALGEQLNQPMLYSGYPPLPIFLDGGNGFGFPSIINEGGRIGNPFGGFPGSGIPLTEEKATTEINK